MQQSDILDAIISQTNESGVSSTPVPLKNNNDQIIYVSYPVEVHLTPVMHTNEIEFSLIIQGGDRKIFKDAVQQWLGKPIKAYMFNETNISNIVKEAVETVVTLFNKLSNEANGLAALKRIDKNLSLESTNNLLREEASRAWAVRDYNSAAKLYEKLGDYISPVEAKRLKLAKDYINHSI